MNDFLKKLNVLIKASLNDAVSGETSRSHTRRSRNPETDVNVLRQRINDAVQYEDQIKGQIRQLEAEVARWDQQADEAVQRGDDASARYMIEQMHRAEQRITLAQGDLREHQRATQELIQNVNTLDAAVAEAQRQQPDTPTPSTLPDLGNVLKQARETITTLAETAAAQREVDESTEARTSLNDTPAQDRDDVSVDDDLERRRQRLSKH